MINPIVLERIKFFMKEKGMENPKQFKNIGTGYIQDLIDGKIDITVINLDKVLKELGVSLTEFFNAEDFKR